MLCPARQIGNNDTSVGTLQLLVNRMSAQSFTHLFVEYSHDAEYAGGGGASSRSNSLIGRRVEVRAGGGSWGCDTGMEGFVREEVGVEDMGLVRTAVDERVEDMGLAEG